MLPQPLPEVVAIVTGTIDNHLNLKIRASEAVRLWDAQKGTGRQNRRTRAPPAASSGPQQTIDSIDRDSTNGHNADKYAVLAIGTPSITHL
jgi:hypothetical protein